jgi:hypothetical protein
MNEWPSSPESKKIITKVEVIEMYKKFVDQGIRHPDDLNLEDPEVRAANELFYAYVEQEDALTEGNEESELRNNLSKTMLYVDAGFTDPIYLDEVLNDWLAQDAGRAEKQSDNPERVETRRQIAQAMNRIKSLLTEQAQ